MLLFGNKATEDEDEEIDKGFEVDPGVRLWFFGRFLHFLKLLLKLIF